MDAGVAEREARAMGSQVRVLVHAPTPERAATLVDAGLRRLDDLEARWSRFRTDSELSRLNAAGGVPLEVGPDTALLLDRMSDAWALTDGRYDPTVHDAVVASGYDVTIDVIRAGSPRGSAAAADATASPGLGSLRLQPAGTDRWRVSLDPGVRVDPGGIGKGLAADLVAADLLDAGALGVAVDVGGDVVVRGAAPDAGGWAVALDHPGHGVVGTVRLAAGAVATSTPRLRRWTTRDGHPVHHVRDPRGGLATVDVDAVTVIGGAGWWAEVVATAALVAAARHADGPDAWATTVVAPDTESALVVSLPGRDRPVRSRAARPLVPLRVEVSL